MFPLLAVLAAGSLAAMAGSTAAVVVVFGREFAPGGPALAVALFFLPIYALDTLLGEGFLAIGEDEFMVRTGVLGQLTSLVLTPILPLVLGVIGARAARIGVGVSVGSRIVASRRTFPGLFSPVRLRRLLVSVALSLPVPILLLVHHFRASATVAIAGGGFLCWVGVAARQWGLQLSALPFLGRRGVVADAPPG